MARRIIVSSNCQTGGIAASLQALLPQDNIVALPLAPHNEKAESELIDIVCRDCDAWVYLNDPDICSKYDIAGRNPDIKLIPIPAIEFSAFHPDICYAGSNKTKELTKIHYNSAIAIWSYKNRLPIDVTKDLFNIENYNALGYSNHWNNSIETLRNRFSKSDLNFDKFFMLARKNGIFMHTINHPKISILKIVSKQVAICLGEKDETFEREFFIDDGLAYDVTWPLYPEIADDLGISGGNYEWKFRNNVHVSGLKQYLEFCYQDYKNQMIEPEDIFFTRDEDLYNRVLGSHISRG